jgi:hypothetical protein
MIADSTRYSEKPEFLSKYVCDGLLACASISYPSLQSKNETDINNYVTAEFSKTLKSFPAETNPALRALFDAYLHAFTSSLIAAKSVVQDVKVSAVSFDASSEEYTCRANIVVDKTATSTIFRGLGYLMIFGGYGASLSSGELGSALREKKDVQTVLGLADVLASQVEQKFSKCSPV